MGGRNHRNRQLETFSSVNSNIGLFFVVVLTSILLGLIINAARWFIYEVVFFRQSIETKSYADSSNDKIAAITATLEENFRYHQFYGAISIICPIIFFLINLVGSGPKATPSQQNGSYRPGKPLLD